MPPPPSIRRPISSIAVEPRTDFAGDLAAIEDDDAIGESDQLVELFGYEQHRAAAVAKVEQALMDEGDAADVDAARRLAGDEAAADCRRTRARSATRCWLPPERLAAGSAQMRAVATE